MQAPFLALITPIGDTGGAPQPPLGIWGPPQMPPGFWGGGMGPGVKPQPPTSGGGEHPSHPIVLPGVPTHPIYWPPYPDNSLPPFPSHPIYIPITPPTEPPVDGEPPVPTHPIYIPVYPAHPIVIPPGSSPEEIYEQIKSTLEFLFGNLPTDPDTKPQPV